MRDSIALDAFLIAVVYQRNALYWGRFFSPIAQVVQVSIGCAAGALVACAMSASCDFLRGVIWDEWPHSDLGDKS